MALKSLDAELVRYGQPAEPGEVIDMLMKVATTIQVELPQEDGMMIYIAILQELPAHILQQAAIEVLKTHTYRTMPLPAEFLGTTVAIEWLGYSAWLKRFCSRNIHQLQRRIDGRKPS